MIAFAVSEIHCTRGFCDEDGGIGYSSSWIYMRMQCNGYEKTPPHSVCVCVFVCICSKSYLLSNIKFLLSAFGVDIAVNRIC